MTILLTNDDGYDADGICYLKNEIKKIEQTVTFAPRQNCSGYSCLLYTSPSPRDLAVSRMPSSA